LSTDEALGEDGHKATTGKKKNNEDIKAAWKAIGIIKSK
jgi:hypothetical protein